MPLAGAAVPPVSYALLRAWLVGMVELAGGVRIAVEGQQTTGVARQPCEHPHVTAADRSAIAGGLTTQSRRT
jgi:hypothetical protein